MKTENEVTGALMHHQDSMRLTQAEKEVIAKRLSWSPERMQGYLDGVNFAYKWVLEVK